MTRAVGDDRDATPRRVKLSKRTVDAACPEANRYVLWDADLAGFGLRVEPSGKKTFIARYRAGGGRSGTLRQATVGRYGALTADEARTKARRILGAAASGTDPVGNQREARRIGLTVAEVCDWYVKSAEGGRILGRRGRPIKASTIEMDKSRIEQHVKPLLGSRPVARLAPQDFEDMQAEIAAGRTAKTLPAPRSGKRRRGGATTGGEAVASRTLGMLKAILEHAARGGTIASNPTRGARKIADRRRRTRLSLEQVRSLGNSIRAMPEENPTAVDAIRFMLLSGFRRNEALGLRKGWLLASGGVDLPDTKSGAQARVVGRAAMEILKERAKGKAADTWLFPADRGEGHFVGVPKALARLTAKANLSGVTPHVLRHSFASIAGDLGYSELVIAGLLGHAAGSVTSGYVHLDSALVAAADRVSSVISDALDGKADADVLSFAAAR